MTHVDLIEKLLKYAFYAADLHSTAHILVLDTDNLLQIQSSGTRHQEGQHDPLRRRNEVFDFGTALIGKGNVMDSYKASGRRKKWDLSVHRDQIPNISRFYQNLFHEEPRKPSELPQPPNSTASMHLHAPFSMWARPEESVSSASVPSTSIFLHELPRF